MNKNALFQLIVAMSIFGSIGFFSDLTGLKAIELVFVRCVCAALFLFTIWIVTGSYRKERWNMKELIVIIACAITNLLNWLFLFKAFELISVTIAISLYHLAPMIVLMLGSFIFKERMTLYSLFAIFLCFIGTIFIMGTDGFTTDSVVWKGILYGIIAAFFYAATMLLGKSVKKTSVYATTFLQMIIGVLVLVPFVNYTSYTNLLSNEWFFAIFTGFVHTGFVYLLFFNSIRYLPTGVVSFMIFVDPVVAIILDIFIIGFRPNGLQFLGVFFIFIGLFYSIKSQIKSRNEIQI